MKKVIKFEVMGKKWQLHAYAAKKYKKRNGKGSVAITDVNQRLIELSPFGTDRESITHELWHAYLGECCVNSADLDEENFEEVCAELFSKRGYEILLLSDKIYNLVIKALIK
jgi:hypothetical protein